MPPTGQPSTVSCVGYVSLFLTYSLLGPGNNGEREKMQELPVHTDQAGVDGQAVGTNSGQRQRTGQGASGERVLQPAHLNSSQDPVTR